MAKLKVFSWSDGFHAFTVATTSRPKALEAWGSGQDLFATGLAKQITSGPDHDAALKAPGEVIERGEAIDLGKIAKAKAPASAGKSDAARRKTIERLKDQIRALDDEFQTEADRIDDQIAGLNAERDALDNAHQKKKAALQLKLNAAKEKR